MRKVYVLLILMFPLILFSQKSKTSFFNISGKILDATTKKPLEDATIIFKNLDSTVIKYGTITNARGYFSIEIEEGNYIVSVEYISYKTKKLNISKITKNFNIGTILLEIDTEFLDEVEIISQKKSLEFKANKIVFNVEKDIASAGKSASEILNNVPSINVDPSGAITLRGQEVTVMINGKTSSMSKEEALKSLPAGSIEKIEVITNPGAKYKASAIGIINIVLKKGKDEGLNASVTTSAGYKDYYGGLLTLNHKSKSINFFTNTSYSKSNPITISNSENEYFENDVTSSYLNEHSNFNNKRANFISTVGADFYLSKNSTLTTTVNYTNLNYDINSLTTTNYFDTSKTSTASNIRDYTGNFKDEIIELIADFEHNFSKEGRTLNASFSYTNDKEVENNDIINSNTSFTDENYKQKTTIDNKIIDIYYLNPISKLSSVTIGYTGEFGKVPFKYISTTNNYIDYSEDVNQGYIDYEYNSDKMYLNVGLRGEFSKAKVDYISLNSVINNDYNNLFPSAALDYNLNDSNSLSVSYRKGIIRPTVNIMQPYEEKISETSSYIGNEKIKPIYLDFSSISHVFTGEKTTISTSFFFNRYKDYWQDVTYETGEEINGVSKIITTPQNIGKLDHYGFDVSTSYKVSNALNFTAYASIYNFYQTGTFETINTANETIFLDYKNTNTTGSLSLLSQLKIPNIFDVQINAKHFLKSQAKYSVRKAYTYASATINKDLFNKDASINLTIDDIFNSNTTKRNRFDDDYFSKTEIKNKYRTIILSFTYRFNQSKKDRRVNFDKKDIKPNY